MEGQRMTLRYQPGERELSLAGSFVRYYRAFNGTIRNEDLDIDTDQILELSAAAFFRDLDSDLEVENAVNMANLYAQAEEAAQDDDDDDGFIYENKSQERTEKDEEPEVPDFSDGPRLGDFFAELFNPNRNNRNK